MTVAEMVSASEEFLAALKRRRTVRDFSNRPLPREVIENAMRAAGRAPSGANRQPWRFVAVFDSEVKRKIRVAAEREEEEFYGHRAPGEWLEALRPLGTDKRKTFLETAPCLIVVFLKKYSVDGRGRRQLSYHAVESVGIATGILITALHLSGVASLTYTPSPMKFLNRILDRPTEERPFLLLVTGYPAEGATVPVIEKLPLGEIATFIGDTPD